VVALCVGVTEVESVTHGFSLKPGEEGRGGGTAMPSVARIKPMVLS
jgi:hypothetical protein